MLDITLKVTILKGGSCDSKFKRSSI